MEKHDPQREEDSATETRSLSEELNLVFLWPFKLPSAVVPLYHLPVGHGESGEPQLALSEGLSYLLGQVFF